MMGLCLGLAGIVWATLPVRDFTLAWMHSIEHVRWEEDYRVTADGLVPGEARIQGSGAGMEPPEDAELRDGSWHYRVDLPPLSPLRVARTPEAGDYDLCLQGTCYPVSHWIGPPRADRPALELWACPGQAPAEPNESRQGRASGGNLAGKSVQPNATADRRNPLE
ncbi:MAG: DUF1850 domain-containing protein [Chromatiaceae bacterium]